MKLKSSHLLCLLILITSCSFFQDKFGTGKTTTSGDNNNRSYGDVVRQRLIDNVPNFRFCYEKHLNKSKEPFGGTVVLKFVITRWGGVRDIALTGDSLKNLKVKGCIIKTLGSIEFPTHNRRQGIEVSQPFNFYPKSI